jgi:rRNA-processing protein FCF1
LIGTSKGLNEDISKLYDINSGLKVAMSDMKIATLATIISLLKQKQQADAVNAVIIASLLTENRKLIKTNSALSDSIDEISIEAGLLKDDKTLLPSKIDDVTAAAQANATAAATAQVKAVNKGSH